MNQSDIKCEKLNSKKWKTQQTKLKCKVYFLSFTMGGRRKLWGKKGDKKKKKLNYKNKKMPLNFTLCIKNTLNLSKVSKVLEISLNF